MSINPDISIILVNWNTRELLKNCIKSIMEETIKYKYEIIVVDNNSLDGSLEMLQKEFYGKIILIKNSQNRGFAVANNQAIKIAKGKHILLLNTDTIVLNRAIDNTIDFILTDPKIGLVGCKLLNCNRTIQYSCYNFNSILRAIVYKTNLSAIFNKNSLYKYEGLIKSFDYNEIHEVDYVCGAYMLFPREIIENVGILDETFFMYAEEADFCARIKKYGKKIIYFPKGEVIHYGGGSSKEINVISENRRIVSRLKFIKKQKGIVYSQLYRFLSAVNVIFKIIKYKLSGNKEGLKACKSKLIAIIKLKYD